MKYKDPELGICSHSFYSLACSHILPSHSSTHTGHCSRRVHLCKGEVLHHTSGQCNLHGRYSFHHQRSHGCTLHADSHTLIDSQGQTDSHPDNLGRQSRHTSPHRCRFHSELYHPNRSHGHCRAFQVHQGIHSTQYPRIPGSIFSPQFPSYTCDCILVGKGCLLQDLLCICSLSLLALGSSLSTLLDTPLWWPQHRRCKV